MLANIGPKQKEKLRNETTHSVRKKQTVFLILFFILPIVVYALFLWKPIKLDIFNSGPKLKDNVLHAVARINLSDGTGSGFLVSDKYVITACHVVDGIPLNGAVTLNFEKAKKKDVKARVVFKGNSNDRDYAVLELDKPIDIEPIHLGTASDAPIKTEINVIGYPGGMFSSTIGAISNDEVTDCPYLVQLDAGAWPGSSGGPILINGTNIVIGILVAGYENEFKGIVLGIKIDALLNDPEFQKSGIKF
jgi:S1-C subfamily serine protease